MTANEREKLNHVMVDEEVGINEHKFLEQLNGNSDKRSGGLYTVDLKKKMIWTRDDEGNYFEQHADGNTKVLLLITKITSNSTTSSTPKK